MFHEVSVKRATELTADHGVLSAVAADPAAAGGLIVLPRQRAMVKSNFQLMS